MQEEMQARMVERQMEVQNLALALEAENRLRSQQERQPVQPVRRKRLGEVRQILGLS